MRAFIALEVGEEIREAIVRLQGQLRGVGGGRISWARPETMHLTLVFLGDISAGQGEALAAGLDTVARKQAPFVLRASGCGMFGGARRPRVIWAGFEACPALEDLQASVADMARSQGVALERRPFKAHLTLGRIRAVGDVDALTSAVSSVKNTIHGSVEISRVLLMKSTLKPQGAEHSVVHAAILKGD
jgi:2'-5' RNA ligase